MNLVFAGVKRFIRRALRFIGHLIRQRSISRALWVDQYENSK